VTGRRENEKRDRATARQQFVAARFGRFDRAAVEEAAANLVAAPLPKAAALLKAFPTGDVKRWVPIGPSVVRRGQANGRPRVSGRIRDIEVSADGRRAYAASAMGGLWYTDDAGSSWAPVGGWADRAARSGGANNAQSCGSVLVSFGVDADHDFVMVGTGEGIPRVTVAGAGAFGGLGVLAALGPAGKPVGANPWEDETGRALLEGLGTCRLVRDPASTAGQVAAPGTDRVLAATSAGLFLGTRIHVAAAPAHDEFSWAKLPGIDLRVAPPPAPPPAATAAVSDVLWLPFGANGRIVVAINRFGVAYSDDLGQTFQWLTGASNPVARASIQGFSSLANPAGTSRVYVLSALPPPAVPNPPRDTPALFRVADMTPAAPASPVAVQVPGTPPLLWPGQRDYDQAIAVDAVGGVDRVYLGGSFFDLGQTDFGASLWCFDVLLAPALGLGPTTSVSRVGAPAPAAPPPPPAGAGDGADLPGHIGNDVHADVHSIKLTGAAPNRQLWVGCDGGVYVSNQAGRVNTFTSRSIGLGALQVGFVAGHPTSTHFVAAGMQDNGTEVRCGDTLWEEIFVGDGGGLVFHPNRPERIVAQFTTARWFSTPASGFVSPTTRVPGGNTLVGDREDSQRLVEFYSGASAVAVSPTASRLAIGTNRVWVTDNLGVAAANTWNVLPFALGPGAAVSDPRPGGTDPAGQQTFGVPAGGALGAITVVPTIGPVGPLGKVVTLRWVTPTELLALFQSGVVRWVEAPAGRWTATVLVTGASYAGNPVLTDIFPVPGPPPNHDFYLTTTGDPASVATDTCYLYDGVGNALVPTGLRHAMDPPAPPAGMVGPLDPAFSVVVDPAVPADVYVGTVTSVWRGARAPGTNNLSWPSPPFVNGLPQAAVQDLSVWYDPAAPAGAPRMLRAAVQARGVWEVDLAAASEPVRTYLRVHARDDRRRFPTPMANPRRSAAAAAEPVFASPDIVVRPQSDPATAPRWLLGGGRIVNANVTPYQVWMFQTAFRWTYPSVVANGLWSDSFGDLVELHRTVLRLPAGRFIDRALWTAVVGDALGAGTRLDPAGAVSANPAHPLAVFRPNWQSPMAMQAVATEVDLLETVHPPSNTNGEWGVFSELSTVEVLLHHRDTRPVPAGAAFALLLWRSGPSRAALLASDASALVNFAVTEAGGNPQVIPAGWAQAGPLLGGALNPLPAPLDARLPRAVPVNVDLRGLPVNHHVLFLAIAGSAADLCSAAPVGLPANPTVSDLARCWPHAALRLVRVTNRPTPGP
jgi:hypothetical protein